MGFGGENPRAPPPPPLPELCIDPCIILHFGGSSGEMFLESTFGAIVTKYLPALNAESFTFVETSFPGTTSSLDPTLRWSVPSSSWPHYRASTRFSLTTTKSPSHNPDHYRQEKSWAAPPLGFQQMWKVLFTSGMADSILSLL